MAFDIYALTVTGAGLHAGDVVTLPYNAGRAQADFKVGGAHFALGPFEQLIAAPARFTVAFNAPNISVTWNTTTVPAGKVVKFQFEVTDGPSKALLDNREVALADLTNVDTSAMGLIPTVSPNLTGTPTAPTAAPGTNTTQIATTAFTTLGTAAAIAALVNSSPATLDTLKELADALGSDPNFATTMATALGLKAPLAAPAFTGGQTFTGLHDVQQGFKLSGELSPAQITANQNDYAPANFATAAVLRLNTDASRTITGLAGGATGRVVLVQNVGAQPLVLSDQDAASTAGNRFLFGVNRTLEPSRGMWLRYDGTSSRWRDVTGQSKATTAQVLIGSDDERLLTILALIAAQAPVAVAFASSQALDFNTGLNFDLGSTTGNFTLANPTNAKVGQSGRIRVPQDATGGRTIAYGVWWKASNGAQALTTTASAVDLIVYYVRSATEIEYSIIRNVQ